MCIADGAIQDLKFLPNGLLLSCSYDKTIRAWEYNKNMMIGEPIEKKDELRCMDVVSDTGTLLIGTNTHAILTHSITDLVNYIRDDDQKSIRMLVDGMSEIESEYGNEEVKMEFDEDGYPIRETRMGDDFGDNFDYNGDNIVNDTIRQVIKDQEEILAADKASSQANMGYR